MELEIRPAAAEDQEFARALNHAAYRDVVLEQFGRWDEEDADRRFAGKWLVGDYRVALRDGERVAALWTTDHADHVFLNDIQVLPQRQGGGIGGALVQRVIAEADARGVPVRLQVLRVSRARALYERLGFVAQGESETHHLMEREWTGTRPRARGAAGFS